MNNKNIEEKKSKINRDFTKRRGISLIALVVTIIVILILTAGIIITVSITNPIEDAYSAVDAYNIDTGKTTLSLLYYDKAMESLRNSVDVEEYVDYLEEKGYNTKEEDGKYYAEAYDMIFELVVEGDSIEIEYVEEGNITEPRIQKIDVTSKTKTEIGIKVTALRMEGGTYYYYIGETEEKLTAEAGSNGAGEFTFTGLTEGITYYIKVVGESTTGETTEKTITEKIEKVPDATSLNMSYTVTWNAGKATVNVTTNTKYKIETSIDSISYEQVSKREGLNNGDVVYARLTDGISSGVEMIILVSDLIKPTLNVTKGEVTTKSIEVNATASDNESGIKEYRYYISDTVDSYEAAEITNETGNAIFEKLDQNTTYYIKVEVEDVAQNIESKEITVKTELIPDAETNITRQITWQADGTVSIELSTNTGYKIVYSSDRVNYTEYTGSIAATNGTNIYICLTDGRNYGVDYKIAVEDYTGPVVNVEKISATSNSIKVKTVANDQVAGMPSTSKYTYYIKAESETDYTKEVEDVTESEYTFTGLNSQTTYNIMVTTKDILGNEGEGKVDVTTEEFKYTSGNVTFASPTWENKLATVKVTNNTQYNMQYQVIAKGDEINLEGTWNTVEEKEIDVGNLKDEYTIIVRLYDGVNTTAGYATCLVEDTTMPTVTVTGNATEWQTANVTLTINATDSESGLVENCYSFDGGRTWQTSNQKEYEENTSGIVIKVKDEAGNIATAETIEITKIDKTGPKMTVETEAEINTIKVSVTETSDTGVGTEETPTYTYYMTEEEGKIDEVAGESSSEQTKTYTGLTQSTTYYIKVEIEDKLGNKTTVYKTVMTGSLNVTAGDLTISDETWENKKASVTITNRSEYKIEYQKVTSGGTFDESANWTKTEEKEVTVTDLLDGDKVYARLTDDTNTSAVTEKEIKDETLPTITVTGNATEWQKENVTLTINATDSESGLTENCYSFDGGETWQASNTKEYEENTSGIVVKVKDEAGNIATSNTINITRIDKTGPEITIQEDETNTKQSTITVTASDVASGLPETITYTYYKKAEGETDYTKVTDSENSSYTYENLTANIKYTLKVETKDKLGNVGEKTIDVTTDNLLYSVGDITFTNIIWSNGIATVTMNNNVSEYDMEYQISEDGSDIQVNGTWTKVSEKQIDIGSLKDTYIIYARITDGYNSTIGYATCNIDNISKETYTEEELANQTQREEYDILGISVTGNEIRVQIDREIEDASLYNYYYKTINDEEYTLVSTSTNYDDPAVITEIKEGAIYKIKAVVVDSSGNVTRSKNTATMVALEEASAGSSYTDNKTYIDDSKTINVRTSAGTGSVGTGETQEVKAGYTVSLPATFKISTTEGENKQEDGVVLIDGNSNEYVWIPVNDAIYDSVTEYATSTGDAAAKTYKPMAKKQSIDGYYESIVYSYNGVLSYRNSSNTGVGKSSYKEPSILTGNASDGYTWNISDTTTGQSYDASSSYYNSVLNFATSVEFGRYIANTYTNMVIAVDSYGGFYVGRYETTAETQDSNIIVGSKPNQSVLSTNNWYKMNLYQDSNRYSSNPYYNVASVTSTMIWGSQWDSMLNYILTGEDASKVTAKTGTQKGVQSNTAQDSNDIMNNIYDLGSNVYEWTQEANSYSYRIYRGGSYDTSTTGTAGGRKNIVPTDQGPVFGSRIGLYMQSVNDVTGPAVKINNIESTSNTISVEVTAIDKETGVKSYVYYISEDGGSTYKEVTSADSGSYTYTGLTQNTEYVVKIVAIDGSGNEGEEKTATKATTSLGNVANTAITRTQRYGPNGSGIIRLELAEEYTVSGYYIEYQILSNGEALDVNGTWTKGSELQGLTNGNVIYASIYDGKNRSADTYTEVVEELEEYSYYTIDGKTSETETVEYTDEEGNVAYIPAGFKVGITETVKNINDGLVIEDASGNQYVWIPVENAIYDGTTTMATSSSSTSTYKPMARYQSGYSATTEKQYFEGILYNFASTYATGSYVRTNSNTLGTSGNREPSLVTASSDYTWNVAYNSAKGISYDTLETYYKYLGFGASSGVSVFDTYTEFGQYMNQEYSNMIKSVEKYGGFYVGRYETSLSGTAGNKDAIPQSKITKTPIYNQTWYKDYYYQDSNLNPKNPNYGNTSVTSSMIWGSQWDAMLNWLLSDEDTKDFVNQKLGNRTNAVQNTGAYSDDFAKNIFDLSSNVTEWAQEAQGTTYREYRGGYCVTLDDLYSRSAGGRYDTWRPPTMTTIYSKIEGQVQTQKSYLGSRMSMYITTTDDTTAPSIEIESTTQETNNIKVSVSASDSESGISKYKYYISYVDFESSEFIDADIIKSVETYGSSYVFTELYQNQSYYIKVEAINNSGLSSSAYTGVVKTDILEIQEGAIVKEKVYGKDGEGIAYFEISSDTDFENQGYYIQYQIDSDGSGYNASGTWTKSNTVKGLSVGDVIYLRLYDGLNDSGYYMIVNVTELESFSETYSTTTVYEDYDTVVYEDGTSEEILVGTAYIPAGFKVSTSSITKKIANGLVIEDASGNQYVWIPVENAIYDGLTTMATSSSSTSTYKPMARYQNGSNTSYEGIVYNFSTGKSWVASTAYRLGTMNQREPSLVTNSTANGSWIYTAGNNYDATNYTELSGLGIDSAKSMGEYLNDKFTEMVESVDKYGGFYVGRYETSLSGTTVQSKYAKTPMASINWYKMYLYEDSKYASNPYNSSTSVTSQMIWGCQWDAMLTYLQQGSDVNKVTAITGNHTGTRATTGQFGNDIMNNIFDLSSNVREWTQEAYSSTCRVCRGGYYFIDASSPATYRHTFICLLLPTTV